MSIFSPVKKRMCPYCLTEVHFRDEKNTCPACRVPFPAIYIEKSDQAPPCFTQIIGWSQVGKTVYMQALTLMLSMMGRYWHKNYYFAAETDTTQEYSRNVNEFRDNGRMPDPTLIHLQDAYIMGLYGMERWSSRTLVMRDVAGESFDNMAFPIERLPYLMYVPTVLVMVSMFDLKSSAKTMDQLMTSYYNTLLVNEKTLKEAQKHNYHRVQRKVVIVLSKADKIFSELPANLQNYLKTDPFAAILDNPESVQPIDAAFMQNYMDKLGHAGEAVRHFIDQDPHGHNMIQLAHQNNMDLRFTIISSTGKDVDEENKLGSRMQPMRVLDPFFWAMEFQSK
jgi:hypothetical protein